jgi:hypothetical protein
LKIAEIVESASTRFAAPTQLTYLSGDTGVNAEKANGIVRRVAELRAAIASIIPVVGTALVWVPAGLYLIFTGASWKGMFVLGWGVAVVSTVDNIIRPWVVSGKVGLHPLVLLFSILGGVEAVGFLGLFLGPVVASFPATA